MAGAAAAGRAAAALLLLLAASVDAATSSAEDAVFVPGTIPTDDAGNPVHAHEGCILQIEDSYLWYGTSQKHNASSGSAWDWISDSISLYVSHDLASWHKRATVFSTAALPSALLARLQRRSSSSSGRGGGDGSSISSSGGGGPVRLARPRVLYNPGRRYYVLIFHLGGLDLAAYSEVGWAVSVSPYGPFVFQASGQPDGLGVLDVSVAAAPGGGDAFLVRGVPGAGVAISRLSRDYLDTDGTGVCSSLAAQLASAVLFAHAGRWYLLGSARRSRWLPSPPVLFVTDAPSPCGASWQRLARPAAGRGAGDAFNSQPAFVLSFTFADTEQVLPIYFGDRWNARGPGGIANASYVWLPLVPALPGSAADARQLMLVDAGPSWRLADFRPHAPPT